MGLSELKKWEYTGLFRLKQVVYKSIFYSNEVVNNDLYEACCLLIYASVNFFLEGMWLVLVLLVFNTY